MSIRERLKDFIEARRNKVLSGEVNCIPTPFPRFSEQFPGIEQGKFYLVSGASKASKTQIMNYLFLYNTILFAYNNPNILVPKIFYYALEETKENITLRFICYLLYTLFNVEISPKDLTSTNSKKPVSKEILNLLDSKELVNILSFYEEHVRFCDSKNPTGVWKDINTYAKNHGIIHKKSFKYKDIDGTERTGEAFDYYEPYKKNEYVMFIVDHVSLLDTERGFTLRETINKLCEYLIIARNNYNYIPVVVQQQNIETIGLDAFKSNKIRPTLAGLADSKDTGKAVDVMLGITNPFSFEIPEYLGYNIKILKGNFRCLEIVLNRSGESNAICPLYFNGAINFYKELPRPSDSIEIERVYREIENKKFKANKVSLLAFAITNKLNKILNYGKN